MNWGITSEMSDMEKMDGDNVEAKRSDRTIATKYRRMSDEKPYSKDVPLTTSTV